MHVWRLLTLSLVAHAAGRDVTAVARAAQRSFSFALVSQLRWFRVCVPTAPPPTQSTVLETAATFGLFIHFCVMFQTPQPLCCVKACMLCQHWTPPCCVQITSYICALLVKNLMMVESCILIILDFCLIVERILKIIPCGLYTKYYDLFHCKHGTTGPLHINQILLRVPPKSYHILHNYYCL